MKRTIYFDMDGTLAGLYDVPNWLGYLQSGDTYPYDAAAPLLNMPALSRALNRLQRNGYRIGIISYLSKGGSLEYNGKVAVSKRRWLARYLPNVHWDRIYITKYGVPKETHRHSLEDILFDDDNAIRENWGCTAYDVNNILRVLATFK